MKKLVLCAILFSLLAGCEHGGRRRERVIIREHDNGRYENREGHEGEKGRYEESRGREEKGKSDVRVNVNIKGHE